ncbi:MAG: LysR family transcriptional regulator [Ostreibacterium sp.]
MPSKLTTIKLFVAVAEHGSIIKAAEASNIVSSAVSKRISDWEESLGVLLLLRKSRGVELTQAGEVALTYAKHILQLVERLEGEMSEFNQGKQGHISIAANPSSIIQFLPQDIANYLAYNTKVNVDLIEDVSRSIVNMVRNGTVDVGIIFDNGKNHDVELLSYRSDQLSIVAPKNHPLSEYQQIHFIDTLIYDYVGLQSGSAIRNLLRQQAEQLDKTIKFSVSVLSFSGVISMVGAGLGISILPTDAVRQEFDSTCFTLIELKDSWAKRDLKLAVREKESLPLLARNFVNYLENLEKKEGS